ncbi:MAG: N-acetylmuramoyl-L-alanine amidase [Bradyrhizobium sp.]|nr:MAG: N-acetylmuramoyl-L-alanine amidase [Bradyrhizobium sp.]
MFFDRDPVVGIHYIIGRTGNVASSTPENRMANHAQGNNVGTISIELGHNTMATARRCSGSLGPKADFKQGMFDESLPRIFYFVKCNASSFSRRTHLAISITGATQVELSEARKSRRLWWIDGSTKELWVPAPIPSITRISQLLSSPARLTASVSALNGRVSARKPPRFMRSRSRDTAIG